MQKAAQDPEEDAPICFVKAYARKPLGLPQEKGQQANALHHDRNYFYEDELEYDNYGDDNYYSDSEDEYYEDDNDFSSEEDEIDSSEEEDNEEEDTSSEDNESDQNELDRYNLRGDAFDPHDAHSLYKHAQYFDMAQPQPIVTKPQP